MTILEAKEGGIVRLKSGGPQMTIQSINRFKETVICTWFDNNIQKKGTFQVNILISS